MILEALVVFGALALVAGLKLWLTWRRIRSAKRLKELEPAAPDGDGEVPVQRR